MASLDITSALNAMVHATTPQAAMERNMATAMFAGRVDSVLDTATDKYEDTAVRLRKLEKEDEIDPEDALVVKAARKSRLDNTLRFHAGYFS